uniref:Uncharacterized protein n=1 Tax=Cucumis melo TaxID=3656 RepID=A0A9I9CQD7_CUCME
MGNRKKNDPIWEIGNEKGDRMNILTQGRKWKNRDRIEWNREEKGDKQERGRGKYEKRERKWWLFEALAPKRRSQVATWCLACVH